MCLSLIPANRSDGRRQVCHAAPLFIHIPYHNRAGISGDCGPQAIL